MDWHVHKHETTFFKRLGMRSLEVVALAAAMLLVPITMQCAIQGFDEIYEILGRRARSPYEKMCWMDVLLCVVLMVGWHLWLGRLTYWTVLEGGTMEMEQEKNEKEEKSAESSELVDSKETESEERRITWSRVLGRAIIPALLVTFGLQFGYQVLRRSTVDPRPLVTRNDVDMQEAMAQLYGIL